MPSATPRIKLYTNPTSPWSHRVHIALDELDLPYEQEIVDINVPRTEDYLRINPRGLVPTLVYDGEVLTESQVIATFLADLSSTNAKGLLPASTEPSNALMRARISLFVQAYFDRATPIFMKAQAMKSSTEKATALSKYVDAIAKELEPQLSDATPFFGGSSTMTLAEVLIAPFVIRPYTLAHHGFMPQSFQDELTEKAPSFDRWAREMIKSPSVSGGIWDGDQFIAHVKKRMGGG